MGLEKKNLTVKIYLIVIWKILTCYLALGVLLPLGQSCCLKCADLTKGTLTVRLNIRKGKWLYHPGLTEEPCFSLYLGSRVPNCVHVLTYKKISSPKVLLKYLSMTYWCGQKRGDFAPNWQSQFPYARGCCAVFQDLWTHPSLPLQRDTPGGGY